MSKRLPPSEPSRPPVRLRLPQISLQELKTIRVAIRRKDVPQDVAVTGPLIRSLDDPEDLVLHKPGEGETPIFDRDDIIVNLDFEERIVVATSETLRPSIARSEERQTTNSRNRRSRSHSRRRSTDKQYYSRSRSRSNERHTSQDDVRNKPSTSFHRNDGDRENRTNKSVAYTDKLETSPNSKEGHRRRKSSSREREHSKYYRSPTRSDSYRSSHYDSDRRSRRTPSPHKYDNRHRKHSRSPPYKRDGSYRDRPRYSKSQERRSRSPYRDRDAKYREYRKRSRSPYSRERYKSPSRKVHRVYSRSPPKFRVPPEDQRRSLPPYQMPPHFGPPWPVYESMPPYVRFVIPDGYIPAPPPRFPAGIPQRPRMPIRLPIYNSRPIPKPKETESIPTTSNTNIATTSSTSVITAASTSANDSTTTSETISKPENIDIENSSPRENTEAQSAVTTTQEIVKAKD